jgi:hypothetical protein
MDHVSITSKNLNVKEKTTVSSQILPTQPTTDVFITALARNNVGTTRLSSQVPKELLIMVSNIAVLRPLILSDKKDKISNAPIDVAMTRTPTHAIQLVLGSLKTH